MKYDLRKIMVVWIVLLLCAGNLFCVFAEGDADILRWERRLFELGYRDGNINGEMDEITQQALINFQHANELEESGSFDEKTVSLLMSEAAKSEREYLAAQAFLYTDTASLSKGSYGDQVQKLQQVLTQYHYFSGDCDGSYGETTEAAVYRFQLANGLSGTGVADGLVLLRLYKGEPMDYEAFLEQSCAKPGDSGAQVRRLQIRLKELGFFNGKCTGRYGESTQLAVKDFQLLIEINASGEADLETCKWLYSIEAAKSGAIHDVFQNCPADEVPEIYDALEALKYPADFGSAMRMETAVCEFQIVNGLEVSGLMDAQTLSALRSGEALEFEPELWTFEDLFYPEELRASVEQKAESLLGKTSGAGTSFEFVQNLLLKNGVALMDESQLQLTELKGDAVPGQILLIQSDDFVCYGIASEEGSFIYCNNEGFVVRRYLNAIDANAIYAWNTEM